MKRLLNDIRDYARAGQLAEQAGTAETRLTAAALVAEVAATSYIPEGFSIDCDPSLETARVTRFPLEQVL